MAATAGARCNSEEPSATSNACERLASQYRDETGEEPPWIPSCYSFTAEEVSNASSNFRDYGCCGGVGVHSVTGEPCAFITCEGYDEVNLVFVGYGVKTFGGVHEECNYSETSITGLCKITKYPFSLPSDWTYDDPGASPTYFFSPSNLPLADYMACADILKGSW
ncbi:MAG: hypothetical protein GTN76_01030 [Candidatus Aenigmarchaeota archaeon]|nr:hypothetical protein [Candidatus Aenigmarchaeota archaeon]